MADFNTLYEQLKASAQSAAKSANTLVTMMTADENTDVGIDGFGLKPSFSKQLKTWTQPLIDQMSAFLDQSVATFDQFLVTSDARVTQFLQNSGYQVIGDYTDGPYTLGNYNSVVKYDGSLYKLKSDTDVPFTTTGTTASSWANDSSHFYAIDGDMLSQQLASDLPGNGSSLIGDEVDGTVKDALVRSRLNTREIWRRSLAEAGLTLVDGSFEEGATVNSKTDAVWCIAAGQCYSWDGAFHKSVPVGSTPASTGGVGLGAWVSVGDSSLRNELNTPNGASLVKTSSGQTVQQEIDANKRSKLFSDLNSAKGDTSDKDTLQIKWKYGNILYTPTGTTGAANTGDGYQFFDGTGKGFVVAEHSQFNPNGIISYTELWVDAGLDPSIFAFAKSFGISTFVVYTYMAPGVQDYLTSWIKCAEAYGIQIILQVFPEVSQDLDMQVAYFNSHMQMPNVVGFYLVDEPTPSTVPLSVQAQMISKVRAVRNLTTYAASNQDLFGGSKYVHKDMDYIFTSVYAYFQTDIYAGYGYYMANLIAQYEENGLRKGRVIPLLTTYRFTDEGTNVTDDFVHKGNCYWIERFSKVAFWQFYTQHTPSDVHRVIENNSDVQLLAKRALRKIQDTQSQSCLLMGTKHGQSTLFNADTDRYLLGGSANKYLFDWFNKNSSGVMTTSGIFDGAWTLTTGEMLVIDFNGSYNLEYVRFNVLNGTGDDVTYRLIVNPVDMGLTIVSDLTYSSSADVVFTIPESLGNKTKQIGLYVVSRTGITPPRDLSVNDIRLVGSKVINQSR